MKRFAILILMAFVPAFASGPTVIQPVTAAVGAEASYAIPQNTVRLSIHPRVAIYLKSVSAGASYPIAANATLVMDGVGMSGKTIYFEAQSSAGYVELLAETK